VFFGSSPPDWVLGAGAGAAAAVAAVAVQAGLGLLGPSHSRAHAHCARWFSYVAAGLIATVLIGPYLVLVLLACGLAEMSTRTGRSVVALLPLPLAAVGVGGLGSLAWVALKVGALSYGGGFVIIPLMQGDAVHVYHWMTDSQFLNAVALGQVTPGPVVATVAAVGYAAHGVGGAVVASVVAFAPSFSFVLLGGGRFERLRRDVRAQAFLDGAGPAAIGAIFGAAILLASALDHGWQFVVLALAAVALLALRRGVVETLVGAAAIGVIVTVL
jgi:chromate transporter